MKYSKCKPLKLCPFCGSLPVETNDWEEAGSPDVWAGVRGRISIIKCTKCNAQVSAETRMKAYDKWIKRT